MATTVPALVDSVKRYRGWEMTRLTCYSVVCDLPTPGTLHSAGDRFPFVFRGNAGLLYKPLGRARRFRTREQIEQLFSAVEAEEGLTVDLDDFWLPNEAFQDESDEALRRGFVFRVDLAVLRLAFDFGMQRITREEFRKAVVAGRAGIRASPEETAAFRVWSKGIVDQARMIYHHVPEGRLSWRGSEGAS